MRCRARLVGFRRHRRRWRGNEESNRGNGAGRAWRPDVGQSGRYEISHGARHGTCRRWNSLHSGYRSRHGHGRGRHRRDFAEWTGFGCRIAAYGRGVLRRLTRARSARAIERPPDPQRPVGNSAWPCRASGHFRRVVLTGAVFRLWRHHGTGRQHHRHGRPGYHLPLPVRPQVATSGRFRLVMGSGGADRPSR